MSSSFQPPSSDAYPDSSTPQPNEKKAIRMRDIARQAGVSERVVSKVLFPNSSNSARASKATAEKIRQAALELGYVPNQAARQLKSGRSGVIGVLMQTPMIEAYSKLISYLELYGSQHNNRLMIGQVNTTNPFIDKSIEGFIEDYLGRGVDGLICLLPEHPNLQERLQEIYSRIGAIVFVTVPSVDWSDWVGTNLVEAVHLLVEHLYAVGRRKIVLLQPDSPFAPYTERIKGFNSAVHAFGLNKEFCFPWPYFHPHQGGVSRELIHSSLESLLKEHPETDAIVAVNDLIAMYTMQYLHGKGIAIPNEIAVTGFDNLPLTNATIPPLTSVDQCLEEVAAKTFDLLRKRIANPERPVEAVHIKPKLYVRQSSLPSTGFPYL